MKTYDFITHKSLGNVNDSAIVDNYQQFTMAQSLVQNNQDAISSIIDDAMNLQVNPTNVTIGVQGLGDRIISLLNFDLEVNEDDVHCILKTVTI